MLLPSVTRKLLAAVMSVSKKPGPGRKPNLYAPLLPRTGSEKAAALMYWLGCVLALGTPTTVGCRLTSGVPIRSVLLTPTWQVPVPEVVWQVLVLLPTEATAPTGTVMEPPSPKLELMSEVRLAPLW